MKGTALKIRLVFQRWKLRVYMMTTKPFLFTISYLIIIFFVLFSKSIIRYFILQLTHLITFKTVVRSQILVHQYLLLLRWYVLILFYRLFGNYIISYFTIRGKFRTYHCICWFLEIARFVLFWTINTPFILSNRSKFCFFHSPLLSFFGSLGLW